MHRGRHGDTETRKHEEEGDRVVGSRDSGLIEHDGISILGVPALAPSPRGRGWG